MPEVSLDELKIALGDVVKDQNAPRVIFPYGFKIVEFKGEKVICLMTPEEHKENLALEGIDTNKDDNMLMRCIFSSENFNCEWNECEGDCVMILGSGWYCLCR